VRAYALVKVRGGGVEEIFVDRELPIEEASRTLSYLERLAPFGIGNAKPLFIVPAVEISAMKQFGKTKNHIELTLSGGGSRLAAMAFFKTPEDFDRVPEVGMRADIVGHLERDFFGGRARLRLVDIV